MEKQMTEQEFRDLYHKMIEWSLPPQDRKDSAWKMIRKILWEDSQGRDENLT